MSMNLLRAIGRRLSLSLGAASLLPSGISTVLIGLPMLAAPTPAYAGCEAHHLATTNPITLNYTPNAAFRIRLGISCDHVIPWVICAGHHAQHVAGMSLGRLVHESVPSSTLNFVVSAQGFAANQNVGRPNDVTNYNIPNLPVNQVYITSAGLSVIEGAQFLVKEAEFTYNIQGNDFKTLREGKYRGWVQPRLYTVAKTTGNSCNNGVFQDGYPPLRMWDVEVTIPRTCEIALAQNIAFGDVAATGKTAQGIVRTQCNGDVRRFLTVGDGQQRLPGGNRQMSSGGNRLQYQLYADAGRMQVWNGKREVAGQATSVDTTIYAAIPAGVPLPPVGDYSDTVLITMTMD